jgi:hypothetical protein
MDEEFMKRQLLSATEQADNFVLWVGDRTAPGQTRLLGLKEDDPLIGAHLDPGLWFIISGLMKAGSIDDRLRVEIRKSRFLIVDLIDCFNSWRQ